MKLEEASGMLDALGHPTRLQLYHLIAKADADGCSVGSLAERLGLPGATMSHHLSKLAKAGLVVQERRGTSFLCRADPRTLMALSAFLLTTAE